ncbi:hypothetical protein R1T08_00710 [Streptomyces sp. SBC-4]|nr:hypothetical protein [Streptomyces sp. SBC-4]MDV5142883.1 hypothetical protein [Streptomyces sp. SBC-4]
MSELLDVEGVLAAVEEYPDLEMCDVCAPWGTSASPSRPLAALLQCRSTFPDGLPGGFR